VDALGAQFPGALRWGAGRVGRADQGALVTLQLDPFGTAVAAALDQLVAQVLDGVGVGFLVAVGTLGEDPHAGVLVAHAALGDVGTFVALVGQLVGPEELVTAGEFNVALENRAVGFAGIQRVAGDVGGLVGTVRSGAAGRGVGD